MRQFQLPSLVTSLFRIIFFKPCIHYYSQVAYGIIHRVKKSGTTKSWAT